MEKLRISASQDVFLNRLDTKYRAFVGGFGSAKTFSGCLDLLLFAGRYPRTVQGYFAPTYPDIRDIFYKTLAEAGEMLGFRIEINSGNKEISLYRGRVFYGTIICRSMSDPNSIVGFKVARALVDEIDILPTDKAQKAWNKIIARLRLKIDGVVNGIGVTTTPEGFKFVYSCFADEPTESYSMVQASTYENAAYLPEDYISSLRETYPEELIDAYIHGKFVNLTSGTVYYAFKRHDNCTDVFEREGEPLRIGMDFNINKMCAAVYVVRGGIWYQVSEIVDEFDTPSMIRTIKEKYQGHSIRVYPDPTGKNREAVNGHASDHSLLEQAGFSVYTHNKSPSVRGRVLAANKAFQEKKLMINVARCPESAKCYEQLAYDKNGEPDKKSNLDHMPDAGTYPIEFEMPIIKPVVFTGIRSAS